MMRARNPAMKTLVVAAFALLLTACGGGGGGGGGDHDLEISIDMTAADFNHDGHVDVALPIFRGVAKSGTVAVFLHVPMAGRGYQARVDYPTEHGLDAIVSGDLDGDGLPDIVANTADVTSNDIFILRNQTGGAGTFTVSQTFAADFVNRIAIADMNGDGRPDLVIAAHTLMLALQAAGTPGSFAAPTTLYTPPSGRGPARLAIGDLNGDGLPDVAIADSNGVTVLFHAAAADPPAIGSTLSVFTNSRVGELCALAIADIDGDGRNDLVVADPDGNSLAVLTQSQTTAGQLLPAVRFGSMPLGEGYAIAVRDLDADGHPDVVTGGSDGVRVFLQDPTSPGNYLASNHYSAPMTADGVAIADVDDDGRPDIISSSGTSCSLNSDGLCKRTPPGVLYQDPSTPGHFFQMQDLR
jgi:FG-GAP-like repeat